VYQIIDSSWTLSDQVFLGTEFSRLEDSGKHSQCFPGISFLSPAYPQGVPNQDIGAWKELFSRIQVKEIGERAHVESFAVAFVCDELTGELRDFSLMDRQQYGYDLEANRVSDRLPVRIDVK